MPNKPETWSLERVLQLPPASTVVLVTAAVADRVREWPFEGVLEVASLGAGLDTLVVVGGGSLTDRAKAWRAFDSPRTRLIAIPSRWGSGAEVSPVVVLDRQGEKDIHMGQEFLPDVRCLWPELADGLPEALARHGCGDVWAHALEGFLSPLATDGLRQELAGLIQEMQTLPIANDPRWFEAGARACAGQARSSVGLVHGIAHTLEGPLRRDFPEAGWGHAKLCSVFLWPVMSYNRAHSDKWERLADQYGLDSARLLEILHGLYEPASYVQALPLLDAHWAGICRDPCTRTNSSLVRPGSKAFFTDQEYS